ncbi:hypothetical protein IFM61606_04035 [Aspergillus udagawae]|nr:hypothetical protein IFM61606_04035 [Aspergillus udagawae]
MKRLTSVGQSHSTDFSQRNVGLAEKDDSTGFPERVERRRRQNRINPREYRKRRRGEALQLIKKQSPARLTITEKQHSVPQTEWQLLERFATAAYQSYSLGCPRIDRLLVLTKANVYRAFLDNITLLGLVADGICSANILSPFNLHGPVRATQTTVIIPPSLRPTSYQRSVPHHPWLDFFPHPKVRDNLLSRQGRFSKHKFCLDIMGFWNPDAVDNMLLVWGEPYDPSNWEVTEGFIKKWGWVMQGCPDILQSTNKWRAKRGESAIFRYL